MFWFNVILWSISACLWMRVFYLRRKLRKLKRESEAMNQRVVTIHIVYGQTWESEGFRSFQEMIARARKVEKVDWQKEGF